LTALGGTPGGGYYEGGQGGLGGNVTSIYSVSVYTQANGGSVNPTPQNGFNISPSMPITLANDYFYYFSGGGGCGITLQVGGNAGLDGLGGIASGNTGNYNGQSAVSYGSGGGGSGSNGTEEPLYGGSGANGVVIISFYSIQTNYN